MNTHVQNLELGKNFKAYNNIKKVIVSQGQFIDKEKFFFCKFCVALEAAYIPYLRIPLQTIDPFEKKTYSFAWD